MAQLQWASQTWTDASGNPVSSYQVGDTWHLVCMFDVGNDGYWTNAREFLNVTTWGDELGDCILEFGAPGGWSTLLNPAFTAAGTPARVETGSTPHTVSWNDLDSGLGFRLSGTVAAAGTPAVYITYEIDDLDTTTTFSSEPITGSTTIEGLSITSTVAFTTAYVAVGGTWHATGTLTISGATADNIEFHIDQRDASLGTPITAVADPGGTSTVGAEGAAEGPYDIPAVSIDYDISGVAASLDASARLHIRITADNLAVDVDLIDDTITVLPGTDAVIGAGVQLYLHDGAGSRTWIDISASVLDDPGVRCDRKGGLEGGAYRYGGGSLTFTIDDPLDEWDPLNLDSPWTFDGATLLRPGLPARVIIDPGDGDDPVCIWGGRVSYWPPRHDAFRSRVAVTCIDPLDRLRAANPAALQVAVGSGDTAAQRITRVLDGISWVLTDLDDTAVHTMAATKLERAAWDELTVTAESDGGWLWINTLGEVVYRNRRWVLDRSPLLSLSMGGETGTLEYSALVPTWDTRDLFNTVKVQRPGGREQAAVADTTDPTSEEGIRATSRTDSVLADDRQVMDQALWTVGATRVADYRADSVTVPLRPNMTSDEWRSVIERDIGDLVETHEITLTGRPIDRTGIVAGISFELHPGRREYEATFDLVAAPPAWPDFILDNDDHNLEGADVLDTDLIGWPA